MTDRKMTDRQKIEAGKRAFQIFDKMTDEEQAALIDKLAETPSK